MLLILLWGFVGYWSWNERATIIASTTTVLERMTKAVEEQATRLFKQAETSLVVANHWLVAHPGQDPGTAPEFIALVDDLRRVSGGVIDIRMVGRDGRLRYIPQASGTSLADVSDRDYFRAQFDPATRGFFIAQPLISRVTGKWGIPVSIPVGLAGGDIAVLFAAIELDRIMEPFEAERLKPAGTITTFRSDGTIMFRVPGGDDYAGKSVAASLSWTEHLGASPKGAYRSSQSPTDGHPRLVSFARLHDYPLIVAVTAGEDDLLAPWYRQTITLVVIAVAVSVACLLLAAVLLRAMGAEAVARTEVERLMLIDPLTGVANRRLLIARIDEEVARAHRYQRPLTLVFFDADHFKRINDSFGHVVGDKVLVLVAEMLRAGVRECDLLGRYGGEEFVVLLIETGLEAALKLAERMRTAIGGHELAEVPGGITVSAGLAELRQGESAETLLMRSDRALYQAKESGRNRCRVD